MNIGGRNIGKNQPPFIIAEMSGNHNQSLKRALQIVDAAADSGAHALKLQTYTADTITMDVNSDDFFIGQSDSLWKGRSLYELYQEASTPWEWHAPIFQRCKERGIIAFSSPFDETAVDFLETLHVPCYKIASFENIHIPLIRKVASTGKPMIMSTGMASVAELDEAVNAAREGGCRDLILLKCTSTYPASPEYCNLLTIPHMEKLFQCQVGLSDHTMGVGVAVAAIALGATVIEKHFTLDRSEGGVDSAFSMEPAEFRQLRLETEQAWQGLGSIMYGPTEKEKASLKFRRSVYASQSIRAGEPFTPDNVKVIRPGFGLAPKHLDFLLQKTARMDIKKGTPITWDVI